RASDALAAALDAQRALHTEPWSTPSPLRVRIALHTADAQLRDEGNYFGQAINRCARLRAVAHGGQTLLSRAVHDLVVDGLAGSGGCGKTRLALQLAAETLDDWPDGAFWVELAPLAEGELIAPALTAVLDVRPLPGRTASEAAVDHLSGRRALVVLDNCEHL